MPGPVLEMAGVTLERGGRTVLRDVDLVIPDAGVTAVVGPSGSGKSSLLRCLNRLEAPREGTVRFRGQDIATLDPLLLRRRVGMVFQRPTPFPGSVRDNLLVAEPAAAEEAMVDALVRAGLDPALLDRPADDLSGGELQRMCLARALVAGPEVLLLDEPTSSLDEASRAVVEETARRLGGAGVPLVWVTHDREQARRLGDRIVQVVAGRVTSGGGRDGG